jgi:hypothetical protein
MNGEQQACLFYQYLALPERRHDQIYGMLLLAVPD